MLSVDSASIAIATTMTVAAILLRFSPPFGVIQPFKIAYVAI